MASEKLSWESIIEVRNLNKIFRLGDTEEHVLSDVSVSIRTGDFVVIYGPSGSGKSTLMNTIIGLEPPTSGEIYVNQHAIHQLNDDERARIRMQYFGVLYQQPVWVKSLSMVDNIALPLIINGASWSVADERSIQMLEGVGMNQYSAHKPTELSGGQQQRASLARALVLNPPILILDEPTGNLDTENATRMIELLQAINRMQRVTVLMVTHNLSYLSFADQVIEISDGRLTSSHKSGKKKTSPEQASS